MMNRIFNVLNSFFEYLFNLFIEFKSTLVTKNGEALVI